LREPADRSVRVELEVRVAASRGSENLTRILRIANEAGEGIRAHLLYGLGDSAAVLLLCTRPENAALALQREGFSVETETAVVIRTDGGGSAAVHLLASLEAAGVSISYSYSSSAGGDGLLVVVRTTDNSLAEDVLRRYLLPGA
jgi:hypothetical protein